MLQSLGAKFGQGFLFQRPALLDGSQDYRYAGGLSA